MDTITYTPEQMKLSARFGCTGQSISADNRDMFEMLMSAVLLGMETAERNLQKRQTVQERAGA